jgi:hypothetical protein
MEFLGDYNAKAGRKDIWHQQLGTRVHTKLDGVIP